MITNKALATRPQFLEPPVVCDDTFRFATTGFSLRALPTRAEHIVADQMAFLRSNLPRGSRLA